VTLGAWIYMLSIWAAILALNVYCFAKVFAKKPEDSTCREENGKTQDSPF